MPDLLLELFSEEIPARMQRRAAEDLRKLVTDALVEAGLTYEGARGFATPRRLALTIHGLTARSADIREEKKGPRVGAPAKALDGFLRGAGLTSIEQAKIESDPKKGDFYVATVVKPGRAAETIIAEALPAVIRDFPWPKSMRWGRRSAPAGSPFAGNDAEGTSSLRWVRPLRSILCTFGPETEEPIVIPLDIDGVDVGDVTYGHRFMSDGKPIRVRRFDDYQPKLEAAKVVLDADRRKAIIETEAKNLAFAQGLDLVEDEGLLEEVAGLVEWPVVLMGSFEERFLEIPDEVIRLTIRQNQKCFVLSDPKTGRLTNRFLLTANIEASDGGKEIVAGNERVIAARLSDARFFWEQDLKLPLDEHAKKLQTITFHEKLGTQAERVERIARLAHRTAENVADTLLSPHGRIDVFSSEEVSDYTDVVGKFFADVQRSAKLTKSDLVTGMVGEFPELQGVIGRYYALAAGEKPVVADAIRDHYRPQGPNDSVPSEPVSIAVALADKLDTLVGFWAIDEKPTGSKDPYALRRAALGVIRIILESELRVALVNLLWGMSEHWASRLQTETVEEESTEEVEGIGTATFRATVSMPSFDWKELPNDLLSFFADRLKVHLRDTGARHDLIDAVFALPGQDDLLMIVRRVEALGKFLDTDDGKNLLAGYKRAANILRAEEKKDGEGAFADPPDAALISSKGEPEEKALFSAMQSAENAATEAVAREDFEAAMRALAELRPAVDSFFDKVTVNADDPELRKNRLRLLNMLRKATLAVADFSKIGG